MKEVNPVSMAFDRAASGYDHDLDLQGEIFRRFRAVLWRTMYHVLDPAGPLVELGCGSGEDTLFLAQTGHQVVATDPSAGMLEVTRQKLLRAGLLHRVELIQASAGQLPSLLGDTFRWRGAISNLGPLNCEPAMPEVATWLAKSMAPGSHLVMSPMAAISPWEISLFLAKAKPGRALVRLRPGWVPVPVGEVSVSTSYPFPSTWKALFSPHFERVATRGLGVFLPPPYVTGMARHPHWLNLLEELDNRFAHHWPWRWLGDHHLMVWRRR